MNGEWARLKFRYPGSRSSGCPCAAAPLDPAVARRDPTIPAPEPSSPDPLHPQGPNPRSLYLIPGPRHVGCAGTAAASSGREPRAPLLRSGSVGARAS